MKTNWPAWLKLCLVGAVVVGVVCATVEFHSSHRTSPQAAKIHALVKGNGMSNEDLHMLQSMGSEALLYIIPPLMSHETWWERNHPRLAAWLPSALFERLPAPGDSSTLRANAAVLVGVLGPKARPAVPYLIELLQDKEACANAAVSLGQIGPEAVEAVPALMRAVQKGVPFAALALAKIGSPAEAVLKDRSRQGPEWQRGECSMALDQINSRLHRSQTKTQRPPLKPNTLYDEES